ncbi:hypothetical protein QAD02_019287 [Eretmocerus hayati]|uniref:Uncharacterized protein n=1 Tax=Eretmocerus hayati TaxID=131215 RepID=A0ACC2PJA2_9HYME|nr:hypothetical protein QAD02_019287 [Eretmocerus hayati]
MSQSTKASDLNNLMGNPETDKRDRILFFVTLAVEAVHGMQRRGLLCNCRSPSRNFRAPLKDIIRDLQHSQTMNPDLGTDFVTQNLYNYRLPRPYTRKVSGNIIQPKREPKIWAQDNELQYKEQDMTLPPNSPPWARYGQPAEYHCVGSTDPAHEEERSKLRDDARKSALKSALGANATSWDTLMFTANTSRRAPA